MNAVLSDHYKHSPYLPANLQEYKLWRERKLALRDRLSPTRLFHLDAQGLLPSASVDAARQQIEAFNFVYFRTTAGDFGKAEFIQLNKQFGLHALDRNPGAENDRVTALRVVESNDARAQYIPYSNRAMNWHTDGYYNPHDRRVNAFALYCAQNAPRGGTNFFFDHEWMYLQIRDQAPELLQALMAEDMMLIPANVQNGRVLRAEETGPVFSLQAATGALNMRYTSRPRNIVWKADRLSQAALDRVRDILMQRSDMVELQLQAGEGVICNNLLHGREAFQDDPQRPPRLVYRARYHDAIDLQRSPPIRPQA